MFKRIVRQVALKHGVYATFMAKPMEHQPGSAMHLHISVVDEAERRNLFADDAGDDSADVPPFRRRPAEIPAGDHAAVCAQRELVPPHAADHSAPINVQWGYDNRSCGLRVPISDRHNRRVENRLPGRRRQSLSGDRGALLSGYLGIDEAVEPSRQARAMPTTKPARCPRPWRRRWTASPPASRCASCSASLSSTPSPAIKEAELEPSRA